MWCGICCLALLGACQRTPSNVASSAGAPRFVNIEAGAEPEYIDPGLVSETTGHAITNALFEGLVMADPHDAHPIPGVASHWKISDDGLVYTFFLRDTAQWSDGKPVTAADFVYSWTRVLAPTTGSRQANLLYYVKNAAAYNQGKISDANQLGVRAIDAHTLEVRLEHPTAFFLDILAVPIARPVPRAVVEQFGAEWTRPGRMISNGPFQLKSWTPQQDIVVEKNPHYWDVAAVRAPGLRFVAVEDLETGFKMYEAGELDVNLQLPNSKQASLQSRADFVKQPILGTYYFDINTKRVPLNDRRVRQALALAIDRETLVQRFLKNTKIAAAHLIPAGMTGYTPQRGKAYDPALAATLLDEAGFKDRSTFPQLTLQYNTNEDHKLIAQIVQQMWQQNLGITVSLRNEEWKSHLKTLQLHNFDIARSSWFADYPDPMAFLEIYTTTSTHSFSQWSNPDFDQLIVQANSELDRTKRLSLLGQAEAVLLDNSPTIPIYTYTKPFLARPSVKGLYPNALDVHFWKSVYVE